MSSTKTVSIDAMKRFVRSHAENYLAQENVTSIGVGYKITGGEQTDVLSIQFTVGRKVSLEMLEAIEATGLPEFVTIDGVEVPTDVLERSYQTSAREVSLPAPSPRKIAVDPIVPGISVAHPSISAGTVGCVVYDAVTGHPYILSNWHVLNGPNGQIGDSIVQPGPHDDNRINRNTVGRLIRSHLGSAGDCAIATIEQRGLNPVILELNVAVDRIGEPELKDRVVKSGRTTAITYGIVQRIHVVTKLDYGSAGMQNIGGFEIGPDPQKPANQGEISLGGDSGSTWLETKRGKPSTLMLGLHFAGEVGDEPDHALACYAKSVFDKLGIVPHKPIA